MTYTFPASDLDIVLLCDADENTTAPDAFPPHYAGGPVLGPEATNYRGQFVIVDGSVYRVVGE
jgi:hypothetical protein